MHLILWSYRGVVALAVGALVYNYFLVKQGGASLYDFSELTYTVVGLAVLAEPVFWASMHLCGGILMGVAAGGLLDGIKLSCILGIGLGLSRCWPYVAAASAGVYAAGGPQVYSIGGAVAALLLFGLDKAMTWFWHNAKPALTGGGDHH